LDDEIDRKIDVSAKLFLLVQNRQQTHGWTLIGSGGNGPAYRTSQIDSIVLLRGGEGQATCTLPKKHI